MRRRRSSGVDEARARAALTQLFCETGEPQAELGRIERLGRGCFRRAFCAQVAAPPGSGVASGVYVVLVPTADAPEDEHAATPEQEAALLRRLHELSFPLNIPRVMGLVRDRWDGGRPLLVETFVSGMPLEFRTCSRQGVRPWEVVARVAAAIHAVDAAALGDGMAGASTRREHAEVELAVFDGLSDKPPLLRDAHAWAREHLPPAAPSVLVHGDLLGQNILLPVFDEPPGAPPGVIDWQNARMGDPAYDLAIVTRGARRPFQVGSGLRLLLDAYAAAGGEETSPTAVRLYEVCMAAGWYARSLDPATRSHPPEQELSRLRSVLRRAQGEN